MKTKDPKLSSQEKELARISFPAVESASQRFSKSPKRYATIKFAENENYVRVPKYFVRVMAFMLKKIAEGKTINLVTDDTEVSTEKAAEILNVSRPYVIKLLESGAIPFKKVGTHRRILLSEVENYHKKMRTARKTNLQKLTDLDQELSLDY